jgi:hypothetical protein
MVARGRVFTDALCSAFDTTCELKIDPSSGFLRKFKIWKYCMFSKKGEITFVQLKSQCKGNISMTSRNDDTIVNIRKFFKLFQMAEYILTRTFLNRVYKQRNSKQLV